MDDKKAAKEKLEKQLWREIPSQIPITCTRVSYHRMIQHCTTSGHGADSLWHCRKSGAKVIAKLVKMNVWNRETGLLENTDIPVATLYCSGCDKAPTIRRGDPIFSSDLQTLAM